MFQYQILASDRPEREDAYSYISDASKDARGFRSRDASVLYMSLAELQGECTYWSDQVVIAIDQQAERDREAIAEFEAAITATIEAGAGDRATAVRWMRDAFGSELDRDYFNWCHDLPYNYNPETGELR